MLTHSLINSQHQKLFATPEEFDQFYGTLQTDLPAWFRLTGFRGFVYDLHLFTFTVRYAYGDSHGFLL